MKENKQGNKNLQELFIMIKLLIMLTLPIYILKFLIFLSSKNTLYVSIFFLIVLNFIVIINGKKIIKKFTSLLTETKEIKKLTYYYITDNNKTANLQKKKNIFKLFIDMIFYTFLTLAFNSIFLNNILKFWGLNLDILYTVSLLCLLGGVLVIIFYKFPTAIYIITPLAWGIVYLQYSKRLSILPTITIFSIYLLATFTLYSIAAYFFSASTLRKLTNKTSLIIFLISLLTSLSLQLVPFYFSNYTPIEEIITNIKNSPDIHPVLKDLYLSNNKKLVDLANYLLKKDLSNAALSIINLVTTALIISITFTNLLINYKIRINENKAKTLFRAMVKDNSKINYNSLVECAYYGGEEYENLMLNNEQMKNIIIEAESNLEIPAEYSYKDKIIKYFKNFFNTIYTNITNPFNKFRS